MNGGGGGGGGGAGTRGCEGADSLRQTSTCEKEALALVTQNLATWGKSTAQWRISIFEN